jgi:hypothetical protein
MEFSTVTDETTDRDPVVDTAKHEAPEAEAPERDEPVAEQEFDEGEQTEGEGEEQQPEEIEFDFGGNKLRVPKGSIPEDLAAKVDEFVKGTWSETTRKNMAIAEHAKALEARERAVETFSALNDEAMTHYAQGLRVKDEIAQLSRIDVNALWQSDPDRARRVSDTKAAKEAELQQIIARVGQAEAKLNDERTRDVQRRVAEGKVAVERYVKGFNDKVPEVIDYVSKTYGIDRAALDRDWPLNPATAALAYKAMMYDRMQASAKKPAPKAAAAPVKPNPPGRGGREVKDVASMSMTEYADYMNRQERAKVASGRR